MESTFKIERYKPKHDLVLKSTQNQQKWIGWAFVLVTSMAILLIIIIQSWMPLLMVALLLLMGFATLRHSFIERMTFKSDRVLIEYKVGFVNWNVVQELHAGIDWFINLREKPAVIKIGHDDKIILKFTLESLDELPLLTESITELTDLEVERNYSLGEWEVLKFIHPNQQLQANNYTYLQISYNALSIEVRLNSAHYFKIHLQKKELTYTAWFITKSVGLQFVESILYEVEPGISSRIPHKASFYFRDKRIQENRHFFSIKRTSEEYQDSQYYELKFVEEAEKLATFLRSIPELKGIEILKM